MNKKKRFSLQKRFSRKSFLERAIDKLSKEVSYRKLNKKKGQLCRQMHALWNTKAEMYSVMPCRVHGNDAYRA